MAVEPVKIAIVGTAGRMPGAEDLEQFHQAIVEGRELLETLTMDDLEGSGVSRAELMDPRYVRRAGCLPGFDYFDSVAFGLTPRQADLLDPQQRHFLEACWQALENAGVPAGTDGDSIAVYGSADASTYLVRNLLTQPDVVRSEGDFRLAIATEKDHLATRVAHHLGLGGPCLSVQSSCSSALLAVALGCQALVADECEFVIAGGTTVRAPHRVGYRYEVGGIHSPDGRCRPFDTGANGTVSTSAVGVVVLERLEHAVSRRANIHAVISGWGMSNDAGKGAGYTAPHAEGQGTAVSRALTRAGVDPDAVGYVEAHGTGTPIGDAIELRSLARVFGNRKAVAELLLGSVKANVGHAGASAGIAGLLKVAAMLQRREIPPQIHVERPRSEIASLPFRIATTLESWPLSGRAIAGVSAFGIGGTNVHVVLEEGDRPERETIAGRLVTWLVSDASAEQLRVHVDRLARKLEGAPIDAASVELTLQRGRRALPWRMAWRGRSTSELVRAVRAARLPPAAAIVGRPVWLACIGRDRDRARECFEAQIRLADRMADFGIVPSLAVHDGPGELAAAVITRRLGAADARVLLAAWSESTSARSLHDLASEAGVAVRPGRPPSRLLAGDDVAALRDAVAQAARRDGAVVVILDGKASDPPECVQCVAEDGAFVDGLGSDAESVAATLWTLGIPVRWPHRTDGWLVALPGRAFTGRRHWTAPSVTRSAEQVVQRAVAAPDGRPVEALSLRVARVFDEALGIAATLPSSDFFELGGDSLLVVQLLPRLEREFGRVPPLAVFLESPTPRAVAEWIASGREESRPIEARMAPGIESAPPGGPPSPPARACIELAGTPSPAVGHLSFSVFFFAGDADASPERRYDDLVELAMLADRLGFEAVWLPDRHFHRFGGLHPNPAVLAAALALRTSRIGLRAGSVVLPARHVVRVAEEWSVVDNLSGGRVGIAIASGFHPVDFFERPGQFEHRARIARAEAESLRRLWRGEEAEVLDGLGNPSRVRVFPSPVQPVLPLWLTSSGGEETFRAAGRLGSRVLTALLDIDVPRLRERMGLYRDSLDGSAPARETGVTLMLHTFVDDDPDAVRSVAREPFIKYLRAHAQLARSFLQSMRPGDDGLASLSGADEDALLRRAFERYVAGRSLMGSRRKCEATALELAQIGVREIACLVDFGLPVESIAESLRNVAEMGASINAALSSSANSPIQAGEP